MNILKSIQGIFNIYCQSKYRVSHKKGIDKNFLIKPAHGFNLQFLNLFGFSISISFVWCII